MKCPKCGYISFDYNQACPKCNKDLTAERERMNLPSYMPKPPSLLESLTGEADESTMDLRVESTGGMEAIEEGGMLTPEDSQTIEAMEEAFKDSQELEIQIEPGPDEEVEELQKPDLLSTLKPQAAETEAQVEEPAVTPPLEDGAEEPSLDLGDLVLEHSEAGPSRVQQQTGDEMAPEPGPSSPESGDLEKTAVFDSIEEGEATESFDLDDFSLDELETSPVGKTPEKVQEGTLVDLDELSLMVDDLAEDEKRADVTPSAKSKEEEKDEGFSLDLETLELDLELEEPEDKSS